MIELINANSIGFSVPKISGFAARTNDQAAKAARNRSSTLKTIVKFFRSQFRIFSIEQLLSAHPLNPISITSPSSKPPKSFLMIPRDAITQYTYPHTSKPNMRLNEYPRSASAGINRYMSGKDTQPIKVIRTYQRINESINIFGGMNYLIEYMIDDCVVFPEYFLPENAFLRGKFV